MLSFPARRDVVATSNAFRRSWTTIVLVLLLLQISLAPGSFAAEEAFKPFRLKTVEGEQKILSDVLGAKATLIVFFFPTCRYCNAAAPELQKLYETYKDRGLAMVWINAVPKEARMIPEWRSQHSFTAPILVGASINALDKDYDVTVTPTHYLLDPEGRIVRKFAGYKTGDAQVLEQAITDRLNK